jgi:hypothetical protein
MEVQEIPYKAINHTLELIASCNRLIAQYKENGEKEDSLMIRQEKHLKKQYMKQLDEMLSGLDIHLML